MKCNDDYAVLKTLSDVGANFDCASKVRTLGDVVLLVLFSDKIKIEHVPKLVV